MTGKTFTRRPQGKKIEVILIEESNFFKKNLEVEIKTYGYRQNQTQSPTYKCHTIVLQGCWWWSKFYLYRLLLKKLNFLKSAPFKTIVSNIKMLLTIFAVFSYHLLNHGFPTQ